MNQKPIADGLARYGRYGDDTLVHMNRDEVAGLQALAMSRGGSLTTNPHTGMPEAFSLKDTFKSILPTVLGAGLAATGIGAPAAALMVGGGYGLATGSLEEGLMAGLGAYGGAGLGGSLAKAGAQPGIEAASQQATKAGLESSLPAAASENAAMNAMSSATNQMMTPAAMPAGNLAGSSFGANVSNMGAGIQQLGGGAGWDAAAQGANAFASNPADAGYGQLLKYGVAAAAPTAAAYSEEQVEEDMPEDEEAQYQQYSFSRQPQPWQPNTLGERKYFSDSYTPYGPSKEFRYAGGGALDRISDQNAMLAAEEEANENAYKKGGTTTKSYGYTPGGGYTSQSEKNFDAAAYLKLRPDVADPKKWSRKNTPFMHWQMYGQKEGIPFQSLSGARPGGIAALPAAAPVLGRQPTAVNANPFYTMTGQSGDAFKYLIGERPTSTPDPGMAAGGLPQLAGHVAGPGDGTSDSIKVPMASGGRAALADGEFVIPARVVAEIGNGSTNAGAKQLYAMLDRIEARGRKAKRGKSSGAAGELLA